MTSIEFDVDKKRKLLDLEAFLSAEFALSSCQQRGGHSSQSLSWKNRGQQRHLDPLILGASSSSLPQGRVKKIGFFSSLTLTFSVLVQGSRSRAAQLPAEDEETGRGGHRLVGVDPPSPPRPRPPQPPTRTTSLRRPRATTRGHRLLSLPNESGTEDIVSFMSC